MTTEATQGGRTGGAPADWKIIHLAPGGTDVFKTPDPDGVCLGDPSIAALPGGRLVVSLDLAGPGVKHLQGAKGRAQESGHWLQGKVFVSADKGKTWNARADYPFHGGRLFRIGNTLSLVSVAGGLRFMRSLDGGDSWSKPSDVAVPDSALLHGPANVLVTREHVYLVLTRRVAHGGKDAAAGPLVPVVLRAAQSADLTERNAWTASVPGMPLGDLLPHEADPAPGVAPQGQARPKEKGGHPRGPAMRDWDIPHPVEIRDASHAWHDARGRALHMLATARGLTGNAAVVARLDSDETGRMTLTAERTATGSPMPLVHLPGGGFPFDVVYDEESRSYWQVGCAMQDSMSRSSRPGAGPAHDPRQRLELHVSRNLGDWSFAGSIDAGAGPQDLRLAPRLAISGTTLYVVCASGRQRLGNRSFTDRTALHTIPFFRQLV